MGLLLDSVILIDHFNNISKATEFIEQHCDEIMLSVISRAEILTGFDKQDYRNAKALLDIFPTLSIDAEIADLAATLRQQHGWQLPDALQAAISKHHDLTLVTRNTYDFDPKHYPFVSVPYDC